MNLYALLGVAEDASEPEIRAAYRKIALLCHPDRSQGDPESEALFHAATEAYRILTHPERRKRFELEFGHVDSVAELFERKRVGKRLLRSVLPTARNAPRAGKTWVQAASARKPVPTGVGRLSQVQVGIQPEGQKVAWYELEGLGEPGKNGGEPGTLWLMIIEGGATHGA
jgi:curved DNA-binding protein CbpA